MSEPTHEERKRLAELRAYGLLDTENEPEFDGIVRAAAAEFGTPIALISLIDENRQWFKARVGLEASETPRTISFCTHAIQGADILEVNDATTDARFARNPLVTGGPEIRYYAGAPLRTPSGRRVGTLCVIDQSPQRPMPEYKRKRLEQLAKKTMELFEKRRARRGEG